MRILQIITLSELGGAQSVVVNLANKLSENNEVIVMAGEGDGKLWNMLYATVKQVHCKHLRRALSPINDFLTIIDFQKVYWELKPDIIHLHSSKVGILGRMVFPKKKTVYTVHGFDSIRIAYRKYLPIEKFFQKRCKAIVGVSNYDRQKLWDEGITNNVYCVFNGIYQPQGDVAMKVAHRYAKKVLCIARVSKQKKFDLFLETAKILPQYAFIWIGNQEEMKNLPKNVFCLGNIPNAGIYNKETDLFMLASNYEGLPMVILEAMSFGKPVVASRVGGISEVIENDVNGYTVDNTAEAFADKIQYVLEDDYVYKLFSANTLHRFNESLTVDKMVKAYMDIYQL
ncbi:glycosyltransferase [Bacteroides congonensis]|jgi:glycosyltransferase involved in cell wall biosynthesis|uniref:glycosyltransferase n=1 Tax=Bacteroides congonensis TaxID=1871006 RepID=UPI0009330323|nr:glycosyltransferase [Bacteroides congonensis]